ncbi:mutagen-sensitive 304 [Halictus rubicundus]|uniref:mutagen-sensitive 304 n=1 Tax=Halictus rubicundus TaxID=77578 RepID=UPI004036991B
MFKRVENNRENEYSIPAKRPKYDTKKGIVAGVPTKGRDGMNKKFGKPDDVWGDDFAEEDIEEMDFVASQACLQEETALTQTNAEPQVSFTPKHNSFPSTSKVGSKVNNINKALRLSVCTTQRREVEKPKDISQILSADYKDFEDKLMNRQVYNSTFKLEESVILPESKHVKELEKLKLENKKLLNDFITKEGEAVFLRNQLQQTQLRAETDRMEKTRFIEEQANRHRTEMNAICKEKEYLKTQLELQTFEVGNLMERCKLLETGNVKLTEPCAINLNTSMNKSKFNSSMNRTSISVVKPVKLRESSVQVTLQDKNSYILKTWSPYYPLANISKLVYDTPQPEKSIVNIQVIEKTGRRNLPILQEEDTFRIFENPELVKPVMTMVDEKRLSIEFILPEIAALQRKTNSELESENSICIMNKLVSTARELILNVIIVLQTIFQAMRNDDIRDMNDIYFSDLYSNSDFNGKSVCDANAWHECERGVEVRRVFGVISYVTLESTYLSKYIAGKTPLLTERDESYRTYSQQMVRYEMWLEKGQDFEMLKMILQFIILVGSTRRAHQFSGLMCAIMMIICNVHKKVEYCSLGMEYVYQIFKEIVFSRPLPYCYSFLSRIMVVFIKSATYLKKLCVNSQLMAVNNWKGSLHFTPDACPLQIFLAQVENHHFDIIAALDITDALLQFVQYVLQTDAIPLRSETLESCNCCMKLLRFTMRTLSKCAEANLSAIGNFDSHHFALQQKDCCKLKSICSKHSVTPRTRNKKCICEVYQDIFSDTNACTTIKQRQVKILRDGIRFLAHLAICDPDFVIRLSDIEDSFHLFMRNISNFDDFSLHENEQEAMNRIKQTFIFDKVPQPEIEECAGSNTRQLDILSNFEKPAAVNPKRNENHNKFLTTITSLYNSKMDLFNH